MKKWSSSLFLLLIFLFSPQPSYAHAFGVLYNLPVPFWLYLYGGAGALIVSFLIIGYFVTEQKKQFDYPVINLSTFPIAKIVTSTGLVTLVKIMSIFLFGLTIISGFIGKNDAYMNFNMTFFWIIIVLGMTYAVALVGNIYNTLNPWKVLVEVFEYLTNRQCTGIILYPKRLDVLPALIFYYLFIWIELMVHTSPVTLSIVLLQYTIMTFIGVATFGKKDWFQYGEFFSVFFRIVASLSPLTREKGKLTLIPPFVGLLTKKAEGMTTLLFILFMLSSTAYDGFRETMVWFSLYWEHLDSVMSPLFGQNAYFVFQSVSLLLSPFVFLLLYIVFLWLAKLVTTTKLSLMELAVTFAYTLVPIAVVYNVAHYYTLLLTQGQQLIALLSDPFGWGWNLFGTAGYAPNLRIIDANITWHSQVGFILLGHIVAVYLAHVIALRIFPSHKKALISQIPMLLLMVSYTMIGLWILSQPITSGG